MKKLHKAEECSLWSDWGIFKRIQNHQKERKEKRKIEEEKELKKKIETERRKAFFKIDENEKKQTEKLKTSSKLDKNKKKKSTRSSKLKIRLSFENNALIKKNKSLKLHGLNFLRITKFLSLYNL